MLFRSAVVPDSAADKAGIKVGDVILSVAGKKVKSAEELRDLVGTKQPDAKVEITYKRDGKEQKTSATLTAAPQRERGRGAPDAESRVWLGVLIAEEDGRVQVERVHPAGPAAKAGIAAGDVILSVGGQKIDNPAQVREILEKKKPEETVEVTVRRNEEEKKLNVTLGAAERFPRRDFIPGPMRMPRDFRGEHRPAPEEQWHERIEKQLEKLTDEVQDLRKELRQHKHKETK